MITQGYASVSLKSFDFVNKFKLSTSINYNEPIIIFGIYNTFDYEVLKKCNSHITIFWAGKDSLRCPSSIIEHIISRQNIRHITTLLPVRDKLKRMGITCELVGFWYKNNTKFLPVKKGNKIYSYIPPRISRRGHKIDRNYYGYDIIRSLNIKDELLICSEKSNFLDKIIFWKKPKIKITMDSWNNGIGLNTYSKCYIGLGLSQYAGGGTSIIEMGLCGIKVITNLIDAPHVIKWETKKDIINIINEEKKAIGTIDTELSEKVYNSLNSDKEWLLVKS